jgi:hypothetical protein
MTDPGGLDTETVRRIDAMRATFERLRTERIRAESDVERLRHELDRAREEARATFGTDSEDEIRALIEAARAENAQRVEAFGSLLRDIEARLRGLGEER